MMRWGGGGRWIAGMAMAVAVVACGPKQTVHVVRPGETLSEIGMAYGVDYHAIARANGITDPRSLQPGRRVVIPGRDDPGRRVARRSAGSPRPGIDPSAPVGAFHWPVDHGRLTSGFGPRSGSHHDGVDIAAPRGLPVVAAAAGEVIYAGRLRGYGNVVIIDHGGGYASVYAHNERNLVHVGERVRNDEEIALVGQSGQASGPHLHFEIRKDNVARDPLRYLAPPAVRAARLESR
jgi:murein DD-endopeptidase MepM/ murein hydrolase activator NlpD